MKLSTLRSGGQRSRSHEADDRLEGLRTHYSRPVESNMFSSCKFTVQTQKARKISI